MFRTKREMVAVDCELRAFGQPLPPAAFFSQREKRERSLGALFIDAEITKRPDLSFVYHQIQIPTTVEHKFKGLASLLTIHFQA
jgi:hypothetical protein